MRNTPAILVPLDFSVCSWKLLDHAVRAALHEGAELVLLHVFELPRSLSPNTNVSSERGRLTVLDYLSEENDLRIQRYVEEAEARGVHASQRTAVGPIAETITQTARELGVRRIIMGTHGRSGMTQLLLGSVAVAVRRLASCPVETLHTKHEDHCAARSCGWCGSHVMEAERRVQAELDG